MLRWSLMIGAYLYEIKYRESKKHQDADVLSRLPLEVIFEVLEKPAILYCREGE